MSVSSRASTPHASQRLVVHGQLRVPGDKSISHRALMLAAIASGPSRVRGLLHSADVHATARVLRALGATVPELSGHGLPELAIGGAGLRGLRTPLTPLDCANSGTTARLMAGVIAGAGVTARVTGDASLSRRPMRRVAEPLAAMGAHVELGPDDGLPMTVAGPVTHGVHWRSAQASAQVKSLVLLAGLVGGVAVSVEEPEVSRDHTERMLAARGVPLRRDGARVALEPVQELAAMDVDVPGDPSSAAFLAALAALAHDGELLLQGVGVNPTRIGFFEVLRRFGARVDLAGPADGAEWTAGEPVSDVLVAPGGLRATDVAAHEVPALIDELPLVACLATRAEGVTTVRGAGELRAKESDRITAVVDNLRAIGADAEELPDGFVVRGSDRPLRGTVRTHGDHRLAMAFGVLSVVPGHEIRLDDAACVAVSYPDFWDHLWQATQR